MKHFYKNDVIIGSLTFLKNRIAYLSLKKIDQYGKN